MNNQRAKGTELFLCQCYIGNDLFKVVEAPDLRPSIYLDVQKPITWSKESPDSSAACHTSLRFDYAGVVEQIKNRVVVRYDFAGIE